MLQEWGWFLRIVGYAIGTIFADIESTAFEHFSIASWAEHGNQVYIISRNGKVVRGLEILGGVSRLGIFGGWFWLGFQVLR